MGKLTDLWRRKSEQAEGTNVATAPGAAGAVLRAGPPAEAEVRPPANTTWAERRRYLDEEVIADATTCHVENRDVGICTRGNGSASTYTVAGTPHRQDVLLDVARHHGARWPYDDTIAAVVMREPTNAHDRKAIAVLVDGIHIGYLFREDAALWQPMLKECERLGRVLVGSLGFYEAQDGLIGARVALRDCLPGYVGPVTKAARTSKPEPLTPQLLSGDDRTTVVKALEHLCHQDGVRTKQAAGMVLKNFRKVPPQQQLTRRR